MIQNIKKNINCKILENEYMSNHTTFGIGGPVSMYVFPQTIKELKEVLKITNDNQKKVFFAGSGSNLLVNDKGYNGVVISLRKTLKKSWRDLLLI